MPLLLLLAAAFHTVVGTTLEAPCLVPAIKESYNGATGRADTCHDTASCGGSLSVVIGAKENIMFQMERNHRHLVKDADRDQECFTEKNEWNYWRFNPWNSDAQQRKEMGNRGDWAKCLPGPYGYAMMCIHASSKGENPNEFESSRRRRRNVYKDSPTEPPNSKKWRFQMHDRPAGYLYESLLGLHKKHCAHVQLEVSKTAERAFNDYMMGEGSYPWPEVQPLADDSLLGVQQTGEPTSQPSPLPSSAVSNEVRYGRDLNRGDAESQCKPQSAIAYVRCCGPNGEKIKMREYGGCQGQKTFAEASETCSRNGVRLCTGPEVTAGKTQGTGCGYDHQMVWTTTTCINVPTLPPPPPPPTPASSAASYEVRYGNDRNRGDTKNPCKPQSATAYVRCCGPNGEKVKMREYGGCHGQKTFAEASETCSRNGVRLCTGSEITAGKTRGTGCGYDSQMVWTTTSCINAPPPPTPTPTPTASPTPQPTDEATPPPTPPPTLPLAPQPADEPECEPAPFVNCSCVNFSKIRSPRERLRKSLYCAMATVGNTVVLPDIKQGETCPKYNFVKLHLDVNARGVVIVKDRELLDENPKKDFYEETSDHEICTGTELTPPASEFHCSAGTRLTGRPSTFGGVMPCLVRLEHRSFLEAKGACSDRGGRLANFKTIEELDDLAKFFGNERLGVGLYREKTGMWTFDQNDADNTNPDMDRWETRVNSRRRRRGRTSTTEFLSRTGCVAVRNKKLEPIDCKAKFNWLCEGTSLNTVTPELRVRKDLRADEGAFCLWHAFEQYDVLPNDEGNGFSNTDLACDLQVSSSTSPRQCRWNPEGFSVSRNKNGQLARERGHPKNKANFPVMGSTIGWTGPKAGMEFLTLANANDKFHCHYTPENSGLTRMYALQHMYERNYWGAMRRTCGCGYKFMANLVSRCDCTRNGVRSNNCARWQREQLGVMANWTVRCNNCNSKSKI